MRFRISLPAGVALGAVAMVAMGSSGAVAERLIGGEQVRNQSLHSVDIAKDGVGVSELRSGSVGWFNELNQFTRDKITDLAGEDGATGPAGTQGERGSSGR